jgi:hypothetical protein
VERLVPSFDGGDDFLLTTAAPVRGTVEPILLKGGGTVKSLSAAFLAIWKKTGDCMARSFPGPTREISAGIFPGHRQSGFPWN